MLNIFWAGTVERYHTGGDKLTPPLPLGRISQPISSKPRGARATKMVALKRCRRDVSVDASLGVCTCLPRCRQSQRRNYCCIMRVFYRACVLYGMFLICMICVAHAALWLFKSETRSSRSTPKVLDNEQGLVDSGPWFQTKILQSGRCTPFFRHNRVDFSKVAYRAVLSPPPLQLRYAPSFFFFYVMKLLAYVRCEYDQLIG